MARPFKRRVRWEAGESSLALAFPCLPPVNLQRTCCTNQGNDALHKIADYLIAPLSPDEGRINAFAVLSDIQSAEAAAAIVQYLERKLEKDGEVNVTVAIAAGEAMYHITSIEATIDMTYVGTLYLPHRIRQDIRNWREWLEKQNMG